MGKIYISFLGTSNYIECTYYYKNTDPVRNVRFVQEATLKTFCSDWTADDKIFIFTTDEAYSKNWLDNGHIDPATS
ncbi:MAG: TM1812 family CRISPR-associated protein, partial [Deltaproteobacteria bacterium]|nr:TM1812 family CRISPR-associated protein [Deltaproteobacteria bacterium]